MDSGAGWLSNVILRTTISLCFSLRLGLILWSQTPPFFQRGFLFATWTGQYNHGRPKGEVSASSSTTSSDQWEDVEVISSSCSPNLQPLMIRCLPYYLLKEFTCTFHHTLRPPKPCTSCMEFLTEPETSRPEASFTVAGDCSKLRKVLLRSQHTSCPTCGNTQSYTIPFCNLRPSLVSPSANKIMS